MSISGHGTTATCNSKRDAVNSTVNLKSSLGLRNYRKASKVYPSQGRSHQGTGIRHSSRLLASAHAMSKVLQHPHTDLSTLEIASIA